MFPLKKIWAAWPYMSLIRCKNEGLPKQNVCFKSTIKCFKEVKIDKWLDLPYSIPPIDCCVITYNKWWAWLFIQWWYSVTDIMIVAAWISKLLYSWLYIGPSEHHHTAQISIQNSIFFFYGASTLLNNRRIYIANFAIFKIATFWSFQFHETSRFFGW